MANYTSSYTGAEVDAAVGTFQIDAQTQISTKTPIVLDEATGDEVALSLDYTVNKATSGNDTGLKLNMTDTASPGTSLLMDLQVGGVSKFAVDGTGAIKSIEGTDSGFDIAVAMLRFKSGGTIIAGMRPLNGYWFNLIGNASLGWSVSATDPTSQADLTLYRDAANTLALRNSTNAQTFNIYNSFSDVSNYERFKIKWDTNRLVLDTEEAGTGSARGITVGAADLIFDSLPTSDPSVAGQLWVDSTDGYTVKVSQGA